MRQKYLKIAKILKTLESSDITGKGNCLVEKYMFLKKNN